MATNMDLNPIDGAVLDNMGKYGKKIKKYRLAYLVKRDIACSDLELTISLKKLTDSGIILETVNNEFVLKNLPTPVNT